MNAALDDVAFLANSQNRVAVLETLADGPHHRDELLEAVDVSRVTLGRILGDLETRRWIERSGQECRATPLGEWVSTEFAEFLETMVSERRFREVLSWFPTERVTFDVRCLRDAAIVGPTSTNISAHVRREADCLRTAQRARVLSSRTAPLLVEATRAAVEERAQQFEGVLTPDLIETVANDATMAPLVVDIIEEPSVDIYVYDDELPVILFIADDTVGLPLKDETDVARTLLLCENDAVYDWAEETFERYRTRAEPVEPDTFTA